MVGAIGRVKSLYSSWHFDWLTQSTGKRKVSVPLDPSFGPVNRILSSRESLLSPRESVTMFLQHHRCSYSFSSLYCLLNWVLKWRLNLYSYTCVCVRVISRCLYFMDTEIHEHHFDVHRRRCLDYVSLPIVPFVSDRPSFAFSIFLVDASRTRNRSIATRWLALELVEQIRVFDKCMNICTCMNVMSVCVISN